jgi:hypothetical protein
MSRKQYLKHTLGQLRKSKLKLQDYNLLHKMIANDFPIHVSAQNDDDDQFDEVKKNAIDFVTHQWQLENKYGQLKTLPKCALILNSEESFDKGVNRILKMIASLEEKQQPEEICSFLDSAFPTGMLNFVNVISLLRYLIKRISHF